MLITGSKICVALCLCAFLGAPIAAQAIAVSSTAPVGNTNNVARNASIVVNFDTPLSTATITSSSFRVWGAQSGRVAGTTEFSNGNQTLTFTPAGTYFPGDVISIQLAHSIGGADSSSLRSAGYAFQFQTRTSAGSTSSTQIDVVSVRTNGNMTRLYGGAITDLNHDGWIDYIAVNEISADLRVLLNRADGSGLLGPVLTPPASIGVEASPSTVADFNNDGFMDVATGNSTSSTVSIALGSGNGYFASVQNRNVGARPHGVVALDVDGDGDLDIVVASENGNSLTLLVNNGAGVFASGIEFANQDGDGKYSLGAGDMNGDGIIDLVVGTSTPPYKIIVLKGNGDGSFTETERIDSGGYAWKLALGDVNNDGKLDVAQANGGNNNGAILFGNGDGTLQNAQIYSISGSAVGSSLGDLDGDGWLDWVISSYSAGEWYVFHNNGDGTFTRVDTINAPQNASCASLYDFDNNGTLDMALADESSDEIVLRKNDGDQAATHADVSITASADPTQYTSGASLTYTVTVSNAGPDDAPGTTVSDPFPAAYDNVSWSCVGTSGASCAASGSGNIDDAADLPSGSHVTYTVTGTVAAGTSGMLTNTATATVSPPVQDPNTSNNSATVQTSQELAEADVGVTISADPAQYTAGNALTYTITVSNSGPSTSPNTTVTDTFPAAYDNVSWTCAASGGGSCAASGNGSISEDVSLPSGGGVTFTVTGTVAAGTSGTLTDSVTVAVNAPATDPSGSNNTATVHTQPAGLPDTIFENGFDPN